ncbi:MAG: ATPase, T2SS/T4P/T4SS family [Candidatus Nanoarchaeia archaeon]
MTILGLDQTMVIVGGVALGVVIAGTVVAVVVLKKKKESDPAQPVQAQSQNPGAKVQNKTPPVQVEQPIFKLEKNEGIPNLPELKDPTQLNVRYPLIPPYAFAHVHWDAANTELVYEIEEPVLTEKEQEVLKTLEEGIKELINLSFISVNNKEIVMVYLEKNIRILLTELAIDLSLDSYLKIMYYIYRDFVGLNELEPLMNDYFIEDVECNGINSPLYVVHRKYRNIRTSLVYKEIHGLASFVEKLAQKCGKYVSYAEPLLNGSMPDGSRLNATYSTDVSSKGPTYCIAGGYIQLSNGSVRKINELFEECKTNFEVELEEGNEVIAVPHLNCCGVEEKDLSQVDAKIKTIIKLAPPEKLVEVKLEDGTSITVTANHLFHIAGEDLKLIEAESLKEGMFVPLPKKINVEGFRQKISTYSLLKEFSYHQKVCVASSQQINELVKREVVAFNNKRAEISQAYNVSNSYFYEILSRGNSISFEILEKMCERNNVAVDSFDGMKVVVYGGAAEGRSKAMSIPEEVNEDLAYLAGAIISDGHLERNSFYVCSFEDGFKEATKKRMIKLFGKADENYGGIRLVVSNTFVSYLFNKIFEIPYGKKAKKVKVPEIIFKSDNAVVCSFIRGLFDGDGTCKSSLSYKTFSKDLAYGLTYLLARIGMYTSIETDGEYYKVNIPSIYEHIFAEKIGFENKRRQLHLQELLKKKTSLAKSYIRHGRVPAKPVLDLLKELKISKNFITKHCKVNYNRLLYYDSLSRPFVKDMLSYIENELKMKSEKVDYVKWLVDCEQEFVKIKSVNVFENKEKLPVYDIELEPCKFFIAGNKPMNVFDTLRKFTKEPWSPLQLVQKGTVTAEILAYLWMLIEYENSFMVVGGTGTGKTSFLNAIAFFMPPQARIVSIEDTRELQLEHENWLPSVSRAGVGLTNLVGVKYGEVSLFDLLRASFRQRPDYIIVGEVRGKEAFILFQAMSSGHPSVATMHAESVGALIRRLTSPPIELSGSLIESMAAVVVMQQTKIRGKEVRKVSSVDEIMEVQEQTNTEKINTVFKWNPANDTVAFNPNSKVFNNVSTHYGLTKDQVLAEYKTRALLLNTLLKQGIVGFKEVQKIIHEYYKSPSMVLKRFGLQK